MDTGLFESLVASLHFEGMFLAKHLLQRKLGQPSGTFIMYTCHQQDPILKVNRDHKHGSLLLWAAKDTLNQWFYKYVSLAETPIKPKPTPI